jgi:hypothetical protein
MKIIKFVLVFGLLLLISLFFFFVSGVKVFYQDKPPSPFDQGDLPRIGHIHIDLFEPTLMGKGVGRGD